MVLEQAVLLGRGEPTSSLRGNEELEECYDLPLQAACERFEAGYVRRLFAKFGGDIQKIADHANMPVTRIRRKMRSLGILRGG